MVIASVPLATPTAWATRQEAANSRSKDSTLGPRMKRPASRTSAMAASMAGRSGSSGVAVSKSGTPTVPYRTRPVTAASGAHERRLAVGVLAQQGTLYVSLLVSLAVVTAFGRTLTLAEFGVYALLVSFTTYLQVVMTSVEGAAVKAVGEAVDEAGRRRALSTALAAYACVGVVGAALILVVGLPIVGLLGVPNALLHEARLGVAALAVVVGLG